jgi:hypothetical protein
MGKAFFITSRLSENISETPEGYLLCRNVPMGRTGEMVYMASELPRELEADDNGKILAFRKSEEIFSPATIASFEAKPFTINHPAQFVSPDNWSSLAKGTIQNVRRGSGENSEDLMADVLVTEALAISLVKKGVREVSCGYECEYVQIEKGVVEQKNIIGNHLALVEEGRAGPAHAITDSNEKVKKMSKLEKIKSLFSKTFDEAEKVMGEEKEEVKDEGKMPGMEELLKLVKELSEKVASMAPKAKEEDEKPEAKEEVKEEAKEKAKDEVAGSVEERLKALEMAVSKIMEAESAESEVIEGEAGDEMEEEAELTGDTASRLEILSPGIALNSDEKTLKVKALKSAYATTDGKAIIDQLSAGKPNFENSSNVDMLFIAASECLKGTRTEGLSVAKKARSIDSASSNAMSAEKMNEINAKRYNLS